MFSFITYIGYTQVEKWPTTWNSKLKEHNNNFLFYRYVNFEIFFLEVFKYLFSVLFNF